MVDAAIIGGGLKLLGGFLGKKSKPPTPSEMVIGAAEGARKGADAYGFNPLTLLQYAGTNAAAGGGGQPAPLASLQILGDIIEDNYSDDAKDRREHNRLANELLALQVEEARTLRGVAPVSAVADMGGVPAFTGGRTTRYTESPVAGDFLTEAHRNPPLADERDNTVSYQSHGQETVWPIGPDIDELLTGLVIDANNRRKANIKFAEKQTVGQPLAIPPSVGPSRVQELMPPIPDPEVERIREAKRRKEFWDDFMKNN